MGAAPTRLRLLAETFAILRRDTTAVAGHAGRDKIVAPAGGRLAAADRKDTDR